MGGIGSGRLAQRPLLETTLELNIAQLNEAGALEDGTKGAFEWRSISGLSVDFVVRGDQLHLDDFNTVVQLRQQETPTNGRYSIFGCPECANGVWSLYLRPYYRDAIACRTCWNLTYKRCNASGSPLRLAVRQKKKIEGELSKLKRAEEAHDARFSSKRDARMNQLERELDHARAELHARTNDAIDALHRRFRKMGHEIHPVTDGLSVPLMQASDEELQRFARQICAAPRTSRVWSYPTE